MSQSDNFKSGLDLMGMIVMAAMVTPAMALNSEKMLDEAKGNIDGYEVMENTEGEDRQDGRFKDEREDETRVAVEEPAGEAGTDGRERDFDPGLPELEEEEQRKFGAVEESGVAVMDREDRPAIEDGGVVEEPIARVEDGRINTDTDAFARPAVEHDTNLEIDKGMGRFGGSDKKGNLGSDGKPKSPYNEKNTSPLGGGPAGSEGGVNPLWKGMGGRGETDYEGMKGRAKFIADCESAAAGGKTTTEVSKNGSTTTYVVWNSKGGVDSEYVVYESKDGTAHHYYKGSTGGEEDGLGGNDSGSGKPWEDKDLIDMQMRGNTTQFDYDDTSSPGGWIDPIDDKPAQGEDKPMDGKNSAATKPRAALNFAGDGLKGHHVVDPIDGEGPDDGGGLGMHVNPGYIDPIDPIMITDVQRLTE